MTYRDAFLINMMKWERCRRANFFDKWETGVMFECSKISSLGQWDAYENRITNPYKKECTDFAEN